MNKNTETDRNRADWLMQQIALHLQDVQEVEETVDSDDWFWSDDMITWG